MGYFAITPYTLSKYEKLKSILIRKFFYINFKLTLTFKNLYNN